MTKDVGDETDAVAVSLRVLDITTTSRSSPTPSSTVSCGRRTASNGFVLCFVGWLFVGERWEKEKRKKKGKKECFWLFVYCKKKVRKRERNWKMNFEFFWTARSGHSACNNFVAASRARRRTCRRRCRRCDGAPPSRGVLERRRQCRRRVRRRDLAAATKLLHAL